MRNKDIQNIIEAISFIEDQLAKSQMKLHKKVEELEKMLTAINIRVADLENSMWKSKKQDITENA